MTVVRAPYAGFITQTASTVEQIIEAGHLLFELDSRPEVHALDQIALSRTLLELQLARVSGDCRDRRISLLDSTIDSRRIFTAYCANYLQCMRDLFEVGDTTRDASLQASALLAAAERDLAASIFQRETWIDRFDQITTMIGEAEAALDISQAALDLAIARRSVTSPVTGNTKWRAFAGGYVGMGDIVVEIVA